MMISCFDLSADEPYVLDLNHFSSEGALKNSILISLQGQIVKVRGFWYPLSADEGILAPTPDLKSCCVKSPTKIYQQMIIKGQLGSSPSQRAMTFEGIFKIDPKYNFKGELIQLYVLDQAREIQTSTFFDRYFFVGAGMIGVGVLIYLKRKQRRKSEFF